MNTEDLRIVILTGAGVSAESGVTTFRGAGGLWEGHRIEEVASPEGFSRNPTLVQQFYNLRRAALTAVVPNAAHLALAKLEQALGSDSVTLITQNVDDLHERAGSKYLLHMHGELLKARCLSCDAVHPWSEGLSIDSTCPSCAAVGRLRPHIVWFGEMPLYLDEIEHALVRATHFVSIGTSGRVYPAAGFVNLARQSGAHCIEFNVERSDVSSAFHEHRIGAATAEVTRWVGQILAKPAGSAA
jgi:NAD-dependent deacetylase